MKDELRRKNRRLFVTLVVFAIVLALVVLLWKMSIYQHS